MLPSFNVADITILVLGDVMLDRFVHGRVDRISPEAPIPVLHVDQETAMPGGAANVARNICSLGGTAILVGVIGNDAAGDELKAMMATDPRLSTDFVVSPSTPTIQKIRYVADQQQLLRADIEHTTPDLSEILLHACQRHLPEADALILSDYAKGVLTPALLKRVIATARAAGVPVIVDPKNLDLTRYDGATLLTPNRNEASLATGQKGEGDEAVSTAAQMILDKLPNTDAVLVTRGARGITLVERKSGISHSPALAKEVFDVSGAGDTVIASLTLALASGRSLPEAVHIANVAAGIAVSKRGTATVSFTELQHALHPIRPAADYKILDARHVAMQVARWRQNGGTVGFTNGCFDLIHPGHISLLSQARGQCDHLIVGLNTDASIKRLKGPTRPVQDETSRAIVMSSLTAVDLVVLFDEDTPLNLIELIRPDILIKGQDYTEATVVGADLVRSYGGSIFLAEILPGKSTTKTIANMTQKTN